MSEQEPYPSELKITYLDLVRLSVDRAQLAKTGIDDATARMIVFHYSSPDSGIFQFVVNGSIDAEAMYSDLQKMFNDHRGKAEAELHLNFLAEYMLKSGNRPPVEGWRYKWLAGSEE